MYTIGMIALQGHCSTVALFKDNKLIWSSSEERMSRIKEDSSLPLLSLEACLKAHNLEITDIKQISFAWNPWVTIFSNIKNNWRGLTFDFLFKKRTTGQRSRFVKFLEIILTRYKIKNKFGICPPIKYIDHHEAHATVAVIHSNFKSSLCLVVDGTGEKATLSLFLYKSGKLQLLNETLFPHSIGIYYAAITQFLNFTPDLDEYKVMGLASYGKPNYLEQFRKLIQFDSENFFMLNMEYFQHHNSSNQLFTPKLTQLLGDPNDLTFEKKADMAFSAQTVLIETLVQILKTIKIKYSPLEEKICFAGGVFQNCALNKKIRDAKIFDQIYITPLCSDLGTAVGAGFHHLNSQNLNPKSFENLYLGEEYTESEIEKVLKKFDLVYSKANDLCKQVAQYLQAGYVVGWFQGRSELGPRALGNRSILADPRGATIRDLVNQKVKKREVFRPFSPAVLNEAIDKYFLIDKEQDLRFMIETVSVKNEFANLIPAVIHVDHTSRIQSVRVEDNQLFYNLISEFSNLTGIGMLLNTSFNVKDEPIVNSPTEAVQTFFSANLDYLIIGPYIVNKLENLKYEPI